MFPVSDQQPQADGDAPDELGGEAENGRPRQPLGSHVVNDRGYNQDGEGEQDDVPCARIDPKQRTEIRA
jgi:hypothetical protein